MAEFNGFEDNFGQANVVDEDPAADFLAREQDELAGLEDEGFVVNGDDAADDHGGFDDGFTMIQNQLNGPVMNEQRTASPLHMYQQPQAPKEVPEKILKWRKDQEQMLTEKDAEEEKKKEELRQNAKHELEEWYKHQTEQIEKTKYQNRNVEKEYVMDHQVEQDGQEWERIAKLCDFNPKTSKNTRDVSRMRSIILQLKQTPLNRS